MSNSRVNTDKRNNEIIVNTKKNSDIAKTNNTTEINNSNKTNNSTERNNGITKTTNINNTNSGSGKTKENNTTANHACRSGESTRTRIPLNLIFDYPVEWSKYKVLRDYIQNFYDAVSCKDFHDKVTFTLDNKNTFYLTGLGIGFNYEWLVHIGATTKRDTDIRYAGFFGEGFKMASLCAIRDHNWEVEISSRNWHLKVVSESVHIDNRELKSISYEVVINEKTNDDTILTIHPFYENDRDVFLCALYSFYYHENPLIGELIYKNDIMALYYRSDKTKPEDFPYTVKEKGEGIAFATYQALGSLSIPLVVCCHDYRLKDRDRKYFSNIDIINMLVITAENLPPKECIILLKMLKKYWNSYPAKKYGYDSYYSVIRKLLHKISRSEESIKLFMEEYPFLLAANKVNRSNIDEINIRNQAMTWLQQQQQQKYKLVQESFADIGYQFLEDKCREENALSYRRKPEKEELAVIQVLEDCVMEISGGFFRLNRFPDYSIITNEKAVWDGFAKCVKLTKPLTNDEGVLIRYHLKEIGIKFYLLSQDSFGRALSVYLHELCHIFGGDRSTRFSKALTDIITKMADAPETLSHYRAKWVKVMNSSKNLLE